MIPASFDYHAPRTLEEAVALLARHRDEAKVLSGGQSLLPLLKLRLGGAGHLVDIGRIPGLEYVKEEDGVSVFYWRDGGFGYALSGAMPREALLPLCNEVYAQLNPGGPSGRW